MQKVKLGICWMALLTLISCAFVQPATRVQSVSITSLDNAIRAATKAARETDWIVKTTDKEDGYILAEREIKVLGRPGRPDAYKLEIDIEGSLSSGKTDLTVKVTPPPGIAGGESPEDTAVPE